MANAASGSSAPVSFPPAVVTTAAVEPPRDTQPLQSRLQAVVDHHRQSARANTEVTDARLVALAGPGGRTVQVKATTFKENSSGWSKAKAVGKAALAALFPVSLLSKTVRKNIADTWTGDITEKTVYSAALSPQERRTLAQKVERGRLLPNTGNQPTHSVKTQEGRAAFAKERYESPQHRSEFTVVSGYGMYWVDSHHSRIVFVPEDKFGGYDFSRTSSYIATDTRTGKHITDPEKLRRTAYQFVLSQNDFDSALSAAKDKQLGHLLEPHMIARDLDNRMEKLAPLIGHERVKKLNTDRMEEIDAALQQDPPADKKESLTKEKERLKELNQRLDNHERALNQAINHAPAAERPRLQAIHDRFVQGDVLFLSGKLREALNPAGGRAPNQALVDALTAELAEAQKAVQKLLDARFCNYEIGEDSQKPELIDPDSPQRLPTSLFKLEVSDDGELITTSAQLQRHLDRLLSYSPQDPRYPSYQQQGLLKETIRHVKEYESGCREIEALLHTHPDPNAWNTATKDKIHQLQLTTGHHLEQLFHSESIPDFPPSTAPVAAPLCRMDPDTGLPLLIDGEQSATQVALPREARLTVDATGQLLTTSAHLQRALDQFQHADDDDMSWTEAETDLVRQTLAQVEEYEAARNAITEFLAEDDRDILHLEPDDQTELQRLQHNAADALGEIFHTRRTLTPPATAALYVMDRDTGLPRLLPNNCMPKFDPNLVPLRVAPSGALIPTLAELQSLLSEVQDDPDNAQEGQEAALQGTIATLEAYEEATEAITEFLQDKDIHNLDDDAGEPAELQRLQAEAAEQLDELFQTTRTPTLAAAQGLVDAIDKLFPAVQGMTLPYLPNYVLWNSKFVCVEPLLKVIHLDRLSLIQPLKKCV